jgi:hypothetical protein
MDSNKPVQEGRGVTAPIAVGLLFLFGLAALKVISRNGGSIDLSTTRLQVIVNPPL